MIEFIQTLPQIKSRQNKWFELNSSQKLDLLNPLFLYLKNKFLEASNANPFAQEDTRFAEKWWLQFQGSFKDPSSVATTQANGLMTLLFEQQTPFFLVWSTLAKTLMAGNAAITFFLHQSIFLQRFQLPPELDEVPFFHVSGDLTYLEVVASHPSVQAVFFNGSQETGHRILSLPNLINKKLQLTLGSHNSALILADANLTLAAEKIVLASRIGNGRWPVNISEVFVLESQLEEFLEKLQLAFRHLSEKHLLPKKSQLSDRQLEIKVKISQEPGQYQKSFEDFGLVLVKDFSHCSPLHQEHLDASVLMVQPVKYAHEMVKWIKAMSHGSLAMIFGSEEKVLKFGRQLPVRSVAANGWIEVLSDIPCGRGSTFVGIPDQKFDGFFFSQPISFDGLQTKI
jgi:hypothetical protein